MGVLAVLLGHGADCASAPARVAHCLQALAPLAQGAIPRSEQFAIVACPPARADAAFHDDSASHATTLARAIAPGEIVAAYPEYGVDMIHPGQSLRLVVVAGAARIERQVEALQPARPGQRLFVKGADGEILSVRYEEGTP